MSTLNTIPQFCEANPAFNVNGVRWIVFRAKDQTDPNHAKFASAIHRVGGRVLIDGPKFLAIAKGEA